MKKTFLNITLAAASICITLVAVEVALRITDYGAWIPVVDADEQTNHAISSGWMREDRELLWRIRECDPYCEMVRHVHPDNPRANRESKGKKRIICIGDSCTFLSGEEMPAYSLGLESLFGRSGGVEVLNAGVPGYSSTQGIAWLRSELLSYNPDLVTVYFGWNDHWNARSVPDDLYMNSPGRSSLRLARLADTIRRTVSGSGNGNDNRVRRVPIEKYTENLGEIDRLLAASGIECIFLTAPAVYAPRARKELIASRHIDEETDYMELHRQYTDAVRALAEDGCHVIDLEISFQSHPDPVSLMMADGIHLGDEGLGLVAGVLHKYILANDLLK